MCSNIQTGGEGSTSKLSNQGRTPRIQNNKVQLKLFPETSEINIQNNENNIPQGEKKQEQQKIEQNILQVEVELEKRAKKPLMS